MRTQMGPMKQKTVLPQAITAASLLARGEPPPIDWVLPGLPARQVGLLVGSDGCRKTVFALQAALGVAGGLPIAGGALDAPSSRGRVVALLGEDDLDDYHRAVANLRISLVERGGSAARIDDALEQIDIVALGAVRVPLLRAGRQADEPLETEWVGAIRERLDGARLAILDPLVMFHSLSESDNGHLDVFMRLLIRLAQGCGGGSILAVHHTSQDGLLNARDDHQAGRGGTALASAARAVWVIRRPSEQECERAGIDHRTSRVVRGSKISKGPEQPARILTMDARGTLFVDQAAENRLASTVRPSRSKRKKAVEIGPDGAGGDDEW